MAVKIKEIPKNERPRERFLYHDISEISNEELLAIILRCGTRGENVKSIASQMLSMVKSFADLESLTIEQLKQIKGVGEVKAVTFLAALELGKRMNKQTTDLQNQVFTNASLVYQYYQNTLVHKKQEYFYCIYLDNRKRMIKEKLLFIGTITHSTIHPREIFKEACMISATAFICIHNHPSGNPKPSSSDITFTKTILELSNKMGIPLLDHIIVATEGYYSFFENGSL